MRRLPRSRLSSSSGVTLTILMKRYSSQSCSWWRFVTGVSCSMRVPNRLPRRPRGESGVQIPTQVAGVRMPQPARLHRRCERDSNVNHGQHPNICNLYGEISDPALIPNSVNLLQLEPPADSLRSLDNFRLWEQHLHNHVYLQPERRGSLQIQVSAAFRGTLKRVLSNVMTLSV